VTDYKQRLEKYKTNFKELQGQNDQLERRHRTMEKEKEITV